ncbi:MULTISPECIES: hypothetical protein [Pseudomonas]|uniref:hypothetical protein n=1 Tax=Pseudomonadaceae TaxID=135621 RepID=UPI00040F6568|nr:MULTISPECIES: hypothetical protein [Pseudomonas]
MSYRSFFLAVLSLTLGGCAVYDYDNDYYGRRYYDGDDYRVNRYYDTPKTTYRVADQRYDDRHYERRHYDGRKDYYKSDKHRYDKRYYDNDRKYRHDRRYHQPRQDNYQERRHDYTPRLQTWGKNNHLQPGYRQPGNHQKSYRQSNYRQQYRVQPGYEARPHNNPRYNNRSSWSMENRR